MSTLQPHLPALQVIVPMLSAPLVVLMKQRRLCWAATTLASLCAFAIAIALCIGVLADHNLRYLMGSWEAPWGIELEVDAFSALLLLIVNAASSLALLAGYASLDAEIESERQPLFYAAWLLALSGLAGILVAAIGAGWVFVIDSASFAVMRSRRRDPALTAKTMGWPLASRRSFRPSHSSSSMSTDWA